MGEVIWYRHEIDGISAVLLSGRISEDRWFCGVERVGGRVTKDTEHWFETEAAALAAAYRLCVPERTIALAA